MQTERDKKTHDSIRSEQKILFSILIVEIPWKRSSSISSLTGVDILGQHPGMTKNKGSSHLESLGLCLLTQLIKSLAQSRKTWNASSQSLFPNYAYLFIIMTISTIQFELVATVLMPWISFMGNFMGSRLVVMSIIEERDRVTPLMESAPSNDTITLLAMSFSCVGYWREN